MRSLLLVIFLLAIALIVPSSSQTFTCDNCSAYKLMLQQCLQNVPQNATTTLNDIQLPLLRCLCKNTTFYSAFGNCEQGCSGKPIKPTDPFNLECQAILSSNPPLLSTSPSGTALVGPYASQLSAIPSDVNPTLLLAAPNATTSATSPISTSAGRANSIATLWTFVSALLVILTFV